MKYYLQAFSKYATIKGRMPRNDFWQFMLFNILFLLLSQMADQLFVSIFSFRFIRFLYQIVLLAPTLSAMVRRLHDTGKSGKWVMLLLVLPVFGLLLTMASIANANAGYNKYVNFTFLFMLVSLSILGTLVYRLAIEGDRGANKYGPDPVEVKTEEGDSEG
jgi:uncharacterized membrane protein YhaH (DUF805 family)